MSASDPGDITKPAAIDTEPCLSPQQQEEAALLPKPTAKSQARKSKSKGKGKGARKGRGKGAAKAKAGAKAKARAKAKGAPKSKAKAKSSRTSPGNTEGSKTPEYKALLSRKSCAYKKAQREALKAGQDADSAKQAAKKAPWNCSVSMRA